MVRRLFAGGSRIRTIGPSRTKFADSSLANGIRTLGPPGAERWVGRPVVMIGFV